MIRWVTTVALCAGLAFAWADVSRADDPPVARIDTLIWRAVIDGNKALVTEHRRITILTPAGATHALAVEWETDFRKLRSMDIRQLDATGKVTLKRTKGDLRKVCGYGASYQLYDDHCTFYERFSSPTTPFTVEYDCVVEYESVFFLHAPQLCGEIPISFAELQITCDTADPVAWKLYGRTEMPETRVDGKRQTLTWSLADLSEASDISYVPLEDVGTPRLALSATRFAIDDFAMPALSWKELGLFYKKLSEGRYLPEAAASRRSDVTRGEVEEIYMDVNKRTRYVAVNIGLSGWRTERAATVQAKGYGDCKGMATLLVSRLRAAGIEAYPVLVLTSDNGTNDREFPVDHFNHVIACAVVGADSIWLDATCDECPPGDLPGADEGTLALLVTDTGGVPVVLPRSRPEENTAARVTAITLSDSGVATVDVTAQFTGDLAHWYRFRYPQLKDDEKASEIRQWFFGNGKRFALVTFDVANIDDITQPFSVRATFTSTKPLDRLKAVRYLAPFLYSSRDAYGDLDLDERTCGVSLPRARTLYDSVTISGPLLSGCDSVGIPAQDSVRFDNWRIHSAAVKSPGRIDAVLRQELGSLQVEPADFPKLKEYLKARKRIIDQTIKLFGTRPVTHP